MGIVLKQSFQNLITTYLGFALGAVNTLFLYVNFMSETYYGLVGFIVSTAFILVPFMAFGAQNTLIKFYSSYSREDQDRFIVWILFLPLLVILPLTLVTAYFQEQIATFLSSKNPIVADYVWYIFLIGLSSAYFEIFFAWAKVQLRSAFGNFLKEVFHRLGVMVLLLLLAGTMITIDTFLTAMVAVYVLRLLIITMYSLRLRMPRIQLLQRRPKNLSAILKYTTLIIVAGSVATLLIDIDKFMIGKYVTIDNVAYYSVAIYIATVIGVPARAMHQITYPMVAEMLNTRDYEEMHLLYRKSSLTLLIISGLLFLLIVSNIKMLYVLVDPAYSIGLYVVLMISASKVLDNCLGINNAIVFNSDYYRIVLFIGVICVLMAIGLNMVFIPYLGINGAGLATFLATVAYSLAKLYIVKAKFKTQPFTKKSLYVFLVIIFLFVGFYFWDFNMQPLVAIGIKGFLISLCYIFIIYKLHISTDINGVLNKYLPNQKSSKP